MSSTASSTAMMAAGIFAHESGQRLLSILLTLADRGFKGLYDKCLHNLAGDYYQHGLRRVHAWSDAVIREDVDYVKASYPDLEETYDACFVLYVADRYRGRKRPTVRTPAILEFVRGFLDALGQHETLSTGDYFARRDDVMLRRIACMDAARTALYALLTAESVRVELLSEAGSVQARPEAPRPPSQVRSLADASDAELRGVGADDVMPSDSISQVGGRTRARPPSEAPRPRAPSEAPRAPSEAPRVPSEAPRAPSEAPRAPSEAPRAPSEAPRAPSEAPRAPRRLRVRPPEAPRAPSEAPRAPSEAPRAPSEAPRAPSETSRAPSEPPRAPSEAPRAPSEPPRAPSPRPPSPVPKRSASSQTRHDDDDRHSSVSRHDFVTTEENPEEEDELIVHQPPPPRRDVYSAHSSQRSNVSIGVKQARSPR